MSYEGGKSVEHNDVYETLESHCSNVNIYHHSGMDGMCPVSVVMDLYGGFEDQSTVLAEVALEFARVPLTMEQLRVCLEQLPLG